MAKYIVKLSTEEYENLLTLLKKGKANTRILTHARILLSADTSDLSKQYKTDDQIATELFIDKKTVKRVRKRFVEEGYESSLNRKEHCATRKRKFDGEQEARFDCFGVYIGTKRESAMDIEAFGTASCRIEYCRNCICCNHWQNFKKNEIKPWLKKEWCIAPTANAEYVSKMEDVLDVYKRSYNNKNPVICMDEVSKQLTRETRLPLPMAPGEVQKYDTEYERNGTANIFMMMEPLTGKVVTKVTQRRTRIDWAEFIKDIVTMYLIFRTLSELNYKKHHLA